MRTKNDIKKTTKNGKLIDHPRILALDVSSTGFGFVVFESPQRLIDWGECNSILRRISKSNDRFEQLLKFYTPDAVIFENSKKASYRGGRRATMIINLLVRRSMMAKLPTKRYSRDQIRSLFRQFETYTKQEIAEHIAKWLPELKPLVPARKQIWETPDRNMRIFNAASLALTFYTEFEDQANKVLQNKK